MGLVNKYPECTYYIVVGKRGNGKTFSTLRKIIDDYFEKKLPSFYIRRTEEQLKTTRGIDKIFCPHYDYIREKSGGKYDSVVFYRGCFYLSKYDENKDKYVRSSKLFCFTAGVNTGENRKGADVGKVANVVLDEFMTFTGLPILDEFEKFTNLLATIIRNHEPPKIFLLGNPLERMGNVYTENFGVDVPKIKQGTITQYKYEGGATAVYEFCSDTNIPSVANSKVFSVGVNSENITKGKWRVPKAPKLTNKIERDCSEIFDFYITDYDMNYCHAFILMLPNGRPLLKIAKTDDKEKAIKNLHFTTDTTTEKNGFNTLSIFPKLENVVKSAIREKSVYYSDDYTFEFFSKWFRSLYQLAR